MNINTALALHDSYAARRALLRVVAEWTGDDGEVTHGSLFRYAFSTICENQRVSNMWLRVNISQPDEAGYSALDRSIEIEFENGETRTIELGIDPGEPADVWVELLDRVAPNYDGEDLIWHAVSGEHLPSVGSVTPDDAAFARSEEAVFTTDPDGLANAEQMRADTEAWERSQRDDPDSAA